MKYIDSEKLKAEIERLRNECAKSIGEGFVDGDLPKTMTSGGAAWTCEQLLSFIASFQQEQPSLPSGLDDAAEKYSENILANNEDLQDAIEDAFKAGAEWYDNQMKMPNSSELISAWRRVKSILQEKDFRGDEWRLAYNAFMFGFSKGLNTRTKKK